MVSHFMSNYGKQQHRKKLQNLPWEEKAKVVVCLQKMAAPAMRARGEVPFVWNLKGDDLASKHLG